MATAPLSDPVVAAVADLFHADRWQPSHDDLTIQFKRAGLSVGDPRNTYAMTGKRKRVRGSFSTRSITTSRPDRSSLRVSSGS